MTSPSYAGPPAPPPNPSVTDPVSRAWEYMKTLLFSPFDIQKWLYLGFCIWLAELFRGGGSFPNFSGSGPGGPGGTTRGNPLADAGSFIDNNMAIIIGVVLLLFVLGAAIGGVVLWLRARGEMMLRYNLQHNSVLIQVPWAATGDVANRWFVLTYLISLAMGFMWVTLLLLNLPMAAAAMKSGSIEPSFVVLLVVEGLLAMFVGFAVALFEFFLRNIVINIHYLRGGTVGAAMAEGWALVASNFGTVLLFMLMRFALNFLMGILTMVGMLVTCCILGCILGIPFVGAVLLLPWHIFQRAYSMYFLEQFGDHLRLLPNPWELNPTIDAMYPPGSYPPSYPPGTTPPGFPPMPPQ